ncbi:hypothetical protein C2G38_2246381 [Gigaspora rosea]|uniref:Uncharacterized protein n=1 Tax=Gigaspora rosea TaxID=44941 RepID=A0A397VDQ4_9GLOM|nr:hypothetical protein C2G38_2246381 [Gigaspora rosea]
MTRHTRSDDLTPEQNLIKFLKENLKFLQREKKRIGTSITIAPKTTESLNTQIRNLEDREQIFVGVLGDQVLLVVPFNKRKDNPRNVKRVNYNHNNNGNSSNSGDNNLDDDENNNNINNDGSYIPRERNPRNKEQINYNINSLSKKSTLPLPSSSPGIRKSRKEESVQEVALYIVIIVNNFFCNVSETLAPLF